jgi:hypothetical protein
MRSEHTERLLYACRSMAMRVRSMDTIGSVPVGPAERAAGKGAYP